MLNPDFSNLKAFVVDQNGDGKQKIGIGGAETGGLKRGPGYQIWDVNGNWLFGQFVLNPD